ncbi:hypothetical protein LCGC14_2492020 [marine sediment metagenome]|uniref:Uncharacterized protein n=1 Tax=marine sediment metagenome TaxID=412755 RepID=A0A0F9DY89_9ZZZZ
MLTPEVIQVVIQGGAVGLLLMFGIMGYRVALTTIDKVSTFVNNHLEHNTEAVREGTEVMREMKTEITRMSDKLSADTTRRVNSEGWELRD